ncbi:MULTISPECIES: SpoIVB peptidase [Brevibacillus]|uniref:Stage IV sporulation protein B n=1 Tax=Brevibacillus borstelensis AK1 TaxID=1300222 RepID=M8E376_9BACL|nr:SpoIVB peptidase [Brevibacillus borstelensis]EMT53721.1 stage IV sporulation protein B [Brevibacillus borstelensis AK1]MBE5394635.1 SpoIVB peptidase [Brevibacillus borstelensis]MCC0562608.1 SpoIVB peptidase [Brevibacillus borstelensis]MCM3469784.1 SpoIVB peptidase [Brevibacillus borstelensis]MCM3557500.1 SpoIVB peptidase [Brevibacillus borstelensis]
MIRHNRRKWMGSLLLLITALVVSSTPFHDLSSFPHELRLMEGSLKQLRVSMPVMGTLVNSNPEILHVNGTEAREVSVDLSQPVSVEPKRAGEANLQVKWRNIPLKAVKVNVLPDLRVIPGGQSIGVKLQTAGVLVVGHHLVDTGKEKVSPGEQAGVHVGDSIIKMNDLYINDMNDVKKLVSEAGEKQTPLQLLIVRGKEKVNVTLRPAKDKKDEEYRMGLYIRDSAAGVGTLTFYEPNSKAYGALGHVISDVDTGQAIVVGDGQIVRASVTSIEKGQSGNPGEKFARFYNESEVLGNITKNSPFGIFGKMNEEPKRSFYPEPIPIALAEQVKEGPAKILTVVEGQKVEEYSIEIVNVVKQHFPATKGMIIKVTDKRLLEKTGGIVQGMSGSPIIQDGKMVGAVTHVFVNDPTSGYGCYIEWMLQDAGLQVRPGQQSKPSGSAA